MNAVARYFDSLFSVCGTAWNRFWFTPADPSGLCVLRVLTGVLALWFLLSFVFDLTTWFGPDGLLPIETVRQLTGTEDSAWNGRLSYLMYSDNPTLLRVLHGVGLLVVAAFTVGFATRLTSVLTLAIILSYIHRGPMVSGPFEPVLTMLLFYLCFAPCGASLSVDQWLRQRRKGDSANVSRLAGVEPSMAANLCWRLIQVHVAALYLMMGLTKLGGSDVWWMGEAMWWLVAHTESRLVDLTFLHRHVYVINLWTHGVVVLELLFGLLVWQPLARPLLLVLTTLHWILIGLLTGLLSFAVVMLVANLCFVSPATMAEVIRFLTHRSRSSASLPSVGG